MVLLCVREELRQLSRYSDYAMNWMTEESRFDSRNRQEMFFSSIRSITALRPTQIPVQWLPWTVFSG
jgi:hypothetical protein